MIFYIKVEVDEFKQRYSPHEIVESTCDAALDELRKMSVMATVSVSPDMVQSGLSS